MTRRDRVLAARADPRGPGATRIASLCAVLAAASYAAWASGTTPFTPPADVAVSVPSAAFAAALVLQVRWPHAQPWRRLTDGVPAGTGRALPWLVVVAVLVGAELASYFHGGPRADYPTISSFLDTIFHDRAAKATVWFVWLTLGWYLARR